MELTESVFFLISVGKRKYYILLSSAHTRFSMFAEFYACKDPTDKAETSPFASPECETNILTLSYISEGISGRNLTRPISDLLTGQ